MERDHLKKMSNHTTKSGYLEGQLLAAMPCMSDPRFERTVIYMVSHSPAGAMGLVVNKPIPALSFPALLEQLKIAPPKPAEEIIVHAGGPVDTGRGFVLHSPDYQREATVVVGSQLALTATIDVLRAIAEGAGPKRRLLVLGHAGWGPGQLEAEIQANAWLTVPVDDTIVFADDEGTKWNRTVAKLGVDVSRLSSDVGHA